MYFTYQSEKVSVDHTQEQHQNRIFVKPIVFTKSKMIKIKVLPTNFGSSILTE